MGNHCHPARSERRQFPAPIVFGFGGVFIDRLTSSATSNPAASTSFAQNSRALGVGLERAGSHEIAHYLLQQAYDLSRMSGVMHPGFSGDQWYSSSKSNLWTFNAGQIFAMNNRCKPATTDTTVPNTSPILRGGGGGAGAGGGFLAGWGGYGSGLFGLQDFLSWLSKIGGGYAEVT